MRLNIRKMSLKRLQALILERGPDVYAEVIAALSADPRGGAQRLVKYCEAKLQAHQQERQRAARMYSYERQVWAMGYRVVAGLGEVGRGPLAGPVVAAAVVLPGEISLPGLDEIKRLSPKRRQTLCDEIHRQALAVSVGMVQPDGIDEASVIMATYRAMVQAVHELSVQPDYLLVDALHLPGVPQQQAPIAGGDGLSSSIAAASVVAKVARDNYMVEADRLYPQYGFANHKGYGTVEHREALERYGPCPIHRRQAAGAPQILPLAGAHSLDD